MPNVHQPLFVAYLGVALSRPMQDFHLALRAELTRVALAARFVGEEVPLTYEDLRPQIDPRVEDHDRAGANRRAQRTQILVGQRRVEVLRRQEHTRRPAHQHRLRLAVEAAAGVVHQLIDRHT